MSNNLIPSDDEFLEQLNRNEERNHYIQQKTTHWKQIEQEDFIDEKGLFEYSLSKEAYHGVLGSFLKEFMSHTEADPSAVLINLLSAFGNIIGRNAHFVADGQKHFLNLFTLIVGDTANGRKGTALRPIKPLFETIDRDWAGQITDGLSSGEGLIKAIEDKEGIVHPPEKRLFIKEEEFSSVLNVMRRDGNTLSPIIRKAWDDGDLHILTKSNPLHATGAHISIVGQISKGELVSLLRRTDIENGFFNRFLFVHSKRSKFLPDGGNFSEERLNHYITELKIRVLFAKKTGRMERNPDASEYWRSLYPYLSDGITGPVGGVTARATAHIMRIACLYALLDMSEVIKLEHLDAALSVWDYCFKTARYVFGNEKVLLNPTACKILDALEKNKELTRTQISKLFHNNLSKQQIDQAIADLNHNGYTKVFTKCKEGCKKPVRVITLTERICRKKQ